MRNVLEGVATFVGGAVLFFGYAMACAAVVIAITVLADILS